MSKIVSLLLLLLSFNSYAENNHNITANPLGFAVGVFNFGYDYKVSDDWTLGGEIAILDVDDDFATQKGESVALRGRYYIDQAFSDTWVLTTAVGYFKSEVESSSTLCLFTCTTTTASAEVKGTFAGAMYGYMWMWENFNMHLGLGLAYYNTTVTLNAGSSSLSNIPLDGVLPVLDFSLGYAF